MMYSEDYFDLTKQKDQNIIIENISHYLNINDIFKINFFYYFKKYTRNINDIQYIIYEKEFNDENNRKILHIIDNLFMEDYPVKRYIEIKIYNNNESLCNSIKIKYNKNIMRYLNILFAKLYNFYLYKNIDDINYVSKNIINNFSNKLYDAVIKDYETYEELKFILYYIIDSDELLNDNYAYEFSLDNIDFIIENNEYISKLGYKDKSVINYNYIYFRRNIYCINNIKTILTNMERRLNNKKYD